MIIDLLERQFSEDHTVFVQQRAAKAAGHARYFMFDGMTDDAAIGAQEWSARLYAKARKLMGM